MLLKKGANPNGQAFYNEKVWKILNTINVASDLIAFLPREQPSDTSLMIAAKRGKQPKDAAEAEQMYFTPVLSLLVA